VLDLGVGIKQTVEENSQVFSEIYTQTSIEGICLQAQKLLEYYLDYVVTLQESPANSKVNEMKKFILERYYQNITLEEIAGAICLNPGYASKLFKKVQGCTVMEYLTNIRVEKAKRLLTNPMYMIDEVASNVGYSDASYFTKVFRRKEGVTPTQYRNTQHR
jgi:YesN/AraC family two-component response regulator